MAADYDYSLPDFVQFFYDIQAFACQSLDLLRIMYQGAYRIYGLLLMGSQRLLRKFYSAPDPKTKSLMFR
jgi:hypothetical protein